MLAGENMIVIGATISSLVQSFSQVEIFGVILLPIGTLLVEGLLLCIASV